MEDREVAVRSARWVAALVVALVTTACTGAAADDTIVVFAAASLTDAFGALEQQFETDHPGTDVQLNLAGSSTLSVQIIEGAPADVFAAANTVWMGEVAGEGAVAGEPEVFAQNSMAIVVPKANPAGITGLTDFARDGLVIGLCAPEVPCGTFARQILDNAGISPALDTNEPDVRSLLTKVAAGELDAAIVYTTDVAAAGDDVEGIRIGAEVNILADYPIAVLADAPNPAGARAFVAFVASDAGRTILGEYGFGTP